MELVAWAPFESLNQVQSRINNLFDESFGRSWANAEANRVWYPAVDIWKAKRPICYGPSFRG